MKNIDVIQISVRRKNHMFFKMKCSPLYILATYTKMYTKIFPMWPKKKHILMFTLLDRTSFPHFREKVISYGLSFSGFANFLLVGGPKNGTVNFLTLLWWVFLWIFLQNEIHLVPLYIIYLLPIHDTVHKKWKKYILAKMYPTRRSCFSWKIKVTLFLGHPVLWNETQTLLWLCTSMTYTQTCTCTLTLFYWVFLFFFIFSMTYRQLTLMTWCCLRHQGPSTRPIICLNGSNQLILSHVHDYSCDAYIYYRITGFIQCLLKSCIAVLCCICNAVLIFMKNS